MRFRISRTACIRPVLILAGLLFLLFACSSGPALFYDPTETATLTVTPSKTSTMTPSPTVTASPTVTLTRTPLVPTAIPTRMPRKRIQAIKNYMIYARDGRINQLAGYDLAIVVPARVSSDDLAVLHASGTLVVAYLSVGEVSTISPWYQDGRVDPKWIMGKNQDWGSFFVDVSQRGWQDLMVSLAGTYLQKGFDGIFMDGVDTVIGFPQTTDGMVALIQKLRRTYPAALIIQNRGFYVLKQVFPALDALMFENVSTSYDFSTQQYILHDNTDDIKKVKAIFEDSKKPVLALDYVAPDDPGRAYRAMNIARSEGFIPAVSVIHLDDIPDYGIDRGGPADIRILSIRFLQTGSLVSIEVQVENAGLTDANQVVLTLKLDGAVAARSTIHLAIGDVSTWNVSLPIPKMKAKIVAVASFKLDGNPDNNSLEWVYIPFTWRKPLYLEY